MGKWIDFNEAGTSKSGKTRVWHVVNREHGTHLGRIQWDAGWRRYVFAPEYGTIFEQDCLFDIGNFLERVTREHKEVRKAVPHG